MRAVKTMASAAAVGGKIYIVGGLTSTSVSKEVECYDPAADAWTTVGSMPWARIRHHVFSSGQFLLIVGGSNGHRPVFTMGQLDLSSRTFTQLRRLPGDRTGFAAAFINGSLYVIGGECNEEPSSLVDEYIVEEGKWREAPDVLGECPAPAACVVHDVRDPEMYI